MTKIYVFVLFIALVFGYSNAMINKRHFESFGFKDYDTSMSTIFGTICKVQFFVG